MLVASPINPVPAFYEHIRAYRAALKTGARPEHPGNVAALFFVCPHSSRAAARAEAEGSLLHYFRTIGEQAAVGGSGQYQGSYAYLRQVREWAATITYETVDQTMAVYGSPEECIARINDVYEHSGIDQLVCWFNAGGLIPHREVMATMERFAGKVMPAVRGFGAH